MATCSSIDIVIGAKTRAKRLALSLGISDLAEALGISELQLARIEKGATRIKASEMMGMCHIFNISPSYFFDAWEIQHTPKPDEFPALGDAV